MSFASRTAALRPGELLSRQSLRGLGWVELLSSFGQGATWPLVVHLATTLGLSGTALGWLLAIVGGGQIASGLVAGPLCDRFGKRRVLEVSLALTAAAWLLVAGAPSVPAIAVAQVLTGLGWACYTASSALLGAHSPEQARAQQFALLLAWRGAGFTLGPALAGVALGYGVAVACLTSVVGSVAALCLTRRTLPESRVHLEADTPGEAGKSGIRQALQLPRGAWGPLAVLLLMGSSATVLGYYVPVHAQQGMGVSAQTVALLFSCMGLTMVLAPAALWVLRKHVGERVAAALMLGVVAFAAAGCALAAGVLGLTAAFFVWALAWDAANPLVRSALSTRVTPQEQSQVMAALQWGQGALNLALPPFSGWLYGHAGALPLFGLTAVLSALALALLWQCFHAAALPVTAQPSA